MKSAIQRSWIDALNDQTQWSKDHEASLWMMAALQYIDGESRDIVAPEENEIKFFLELLGQMRRVIYRLHFETEESTHSSAFDSSFLSTHLSKLTLSLDTSRTPSLIASLTPDTLKQSKYSSVFGTIVHNFAVDLSRMIESGDGIIIHRCEGVFRDSNAQEISVVSGVSNNIESLWRNEIPLLVEKSLEEAPEIQRCADLFISQSRSKYCSDACRFTTFQIAKQLKDPSYLAEKQRRYRQKKSKA